MTPVFFPNNDISPFRRLRIQRAQEYGARWSREWAADVTHAVFDKELKLNDLRVHLKVESLPVGLHTRKPYPLLTKRQAGVAVVNESYPSECIRFRSVLNHSQLRFRVADNISVAQKDQAPVNQLSDSLPLKSPLRRRDKPVDQLDSPFEFAVPESYPEELVAEPIQKVTDTEETDNCFWGRDALDDIIDEAKATSHLVSSSICEWSLISLMRLNSL